jgi:hypothetical protein
MPWGSKNSLGFYEECISPQNLTLWTNGKALGPFSNTEQTANGAIIAQNAAGVWLFDSRELFGPYAAIDQSLVIKDSADKEYLYLASTTEGMFLFRHGKIIAGPFGLRKGKVNDDGFSVSDHRAEVFRLFRDGSLAAVLHVSDGCLVNLTQISADAIFSGYERSIKK